MMNMQYPPCGRLCDLCEARKEGACLGCTETHGKPFHLKGETCPLFGCSTEHNVEDCGQCPEFPCAKYLDWYNPAHGKKSVLPYVGLLFIRNKLGTEEWRKWVGIHKEK